MDLDQTVRLVAMCRAAQPGWTPIDGTAELWHAAAFHDIDASDAEQALLEHVRDEGGWPDSAKLRVRALRIGRRRRGQERQEQLGGAPGWCGVPGCDCEPPSAAQALQQASNARLLGAAVAGVFRTVE